MSICLFNKIQNRAILDKILFLGFPYFRAHHKDKRIASKASRSYSIKLSINFKYVYLMEEFLGISDILDYELYARGLLITLYAIFIFRLNLSRLYGSHSALDFIIYIILGAILGEAIVNNIPLLPSIITTTLIVMIYKCLAYLTYKSHRVGKYIKGEKIFIIRNGKYIKKNLQCTRLTTHDVLQALRVQHGRNDIESLEAAILERGGEISFQLKKEKN